MLHGSQVDHHTVLWLTNLPGKHHRGNQIVASFPVAKKYMIHSIGNIYIQFSQMAKDDFFLRRQRWFYDFEILQMANFFIKLTIAKQKNINTIGFFLPG